MPLSTSQVVQLQVGERRFITKIETLAEKSRYLSSVFSDRWDTQRQEDGSFFFDFDGDAF